MITSTDEIQFTANGVDELFTVGRWLNEEME
jgi:hypothetical protein